MAFEGVNLWLPVPFSRCLNLAKTPMRIAVRINTLLPLSAETVREYCSLCRNIFLLPASLVNKALFFLPILAFYSHFLLQWARRRSFPPRDIIAASAFSVSARSIYPFSKIICCKHLYRLQSFGLVSAMAALRQLRCIGLRISACI